ncbi:Pkinase-domain-containing protein [Microstroma glucosiphilum]|uniref:Mitogen-activated protein kinase n=1 Tax=Pseudomicrostroma glucosiphilum TaxID=1684307 RepID=A0A316U9V9_9BASI|nr:Pkinase-domain-containing protein [Pseudomicrostroma glucosiphilum]PWN19795.1 Pkinase-domain-containing protein [Pseudomicrostroma glucosiphilum]
MSHSHSSSSSSGPSGSSTGPARTPYSVLGQTFLIDSAYSISKELGQGAYGCVAAATHNATGESVAIKKITNVFSKRILTKRALREIKLLRHFRYHKNITSLFDMDVIDPRQFNEVYLYEELMEADLHAIIRSGQPLSDAHFQSFIYQTLCGLKYIHSASVLHRDLKPGNLLVNADCELKICDFGLARGFETDPEAASKQAGGGFMTEYVATRWYRAPEIMLSFQNYTTAIDVWSVGCILAELLGGKPIFKGRDYVDQLNQILHYLGTPSEETLRRVGSPRAQEYIRSLPYKQRIPFSTLYPNANPLALDLLEKMLAFDPALRISCEEALQHPYLAVWHDPIDEPLCPRKFDFGFEAVDDTEGMKALILEEVRSFRQEVRQSAAAAAAADEANAAAEAAATAAAANQTSSSSGSGARRQDSLPIPTREEIQKSSPTTMDDVMSYGGGGGGGGGVGHSHHNQQQQQQQNVYQQPQYQQQSYQHHQHSHHQGGGQQQQVLGASAGLVYAGGDEMTEEPNEALERELSGQ